MRHRASVVIASAQFGSRLIASIAESVGRGYDPFVDGLSSSSHALSLKIRSRSNRNFPEEENYSHREKRRRKGYLPSLYFWDCSKARTYVHPKRVEHPTQKISATCRGFLVKLGGYGQKGTVRTVWTPVRSWRCSCDPSLMLTALCSKLCPSCMNNLFA